MVSLSKQRRRTDGFLYAKQIRRPDVFLVLNIEAEQMVSLSNRKAEQMVFLSKQRSRADGFFF